MSWKNAPVVDSSASYMDASEVAADATPEDVMDLNFEGKRTPGVTAALRVLQKRYANAPLSNVNERIVESMTLGGAGELARRMGAGYVGLQRKAGAELPYTEKEYLQAAKLFDAARREAYAAEYPVRAFAGDIAGGVMTPGGVALGKFVQGAKAARLSAAGAKIPKSVRAMQLARLSGVGGVTSATQGALQARPGEAGTEAVNLGILGAVLAPAIGVAAPAAVKLGKAAYDKISNIVVPRTEAQIASAKLQKILQKANVTPALIKTAVEHFAKTGSVTPTVYDVLRKAGASPDVLTVFRTQGTTPRTRVSATKYAEETARNVQPRSVAAVRKLPTGGENRTPSQIRAELEAEAAGAIAQTQKATEGVASAPVGPARNSGARELYVKLNAEYDASKAAYEEPFSRAQDAHPESAVIPDEERAPVISAVISDLGHLNVEIPEVKKIALMIEKLRQGRTSVAKETLPPLPEEVQKLMDKAPEAMRTQIETSARKQLGLDKPVAAPVKTANSRPLTVQQIWDTREALGNIADNTKSKNVMRIVARGKEALDNELDRLLAEGKIEGDPEVINAWREGLNGYFQHQSKFGTGLAAELSARVPGKPDQTMVKPYQAGDVIFGKGASVKNLNDLRAELEPITEIIPDAVNAVQRELYTRIPSEDLPKTQARFNEVFSDLLPSDLTSQAERARIQAAQVESDNAKLLADTAARRARIEDAVTLGERLRSMPSEEFTGKIANLPSNLRSIVQASGKQQLLNALEEPAPGSTGLLEQMQRERDKTNFGALYGNAGAALQRTLQGIEAQTQGAQELAQSVGGRSSQNETFVTSPRDLVNVRWLLADKLLEKLHNKIALTPAESASLMDLMRSQGAPDLAALEDMTRVRSVGPLPRFSTAAARGLAAPRDAEAVNRLDENYEPEEY